jgi:hypothetical protein
MLAFFWCLGAVRFAMWEYVRKCVRDLLSIPNLSVSALVLVLRGPALRMYM